MIKIFSSTDKTYLSNGDAVILATKARVKNADNGDFYLDLTCGVEYNDYLQPNNIIVAPTPAGEQAFRIRSITKTAKKIEVKAWHVYYDSQNYLIQDSYAVNMTANEALDHFNKATDTTSPFTTLSNITTALSYRCVRTSLCDCITEVINRWGGHLKRDNWSIQLLSNIGVDNGITIEYKKNLKELTAEYNWDGVVTKLLPVGKDGTLLDEIYVYSDIQYDIPYTKTVSFEQGIDEENYKDNDGNTDKEAYSAALKADLKEQAQNYVNKACYPTVNYTLKGNPEKVSDLGDIIRVKDARIGVDLLTSVIAYEYNALTNKYVSLEFGNFTKTINGLMGNIERDTKTQVGQAVSGKQDKLTAGENITISGDVISSKDTTYAAGANITINDGVISATDTTYTAGENITITNNVISGKAYTAGYGIDITNNVVSAETISEDTEIVKNSHLGVIGIKSTNGLDFGVPLPKPWASGVIELTSLSIEVYTSYAGATVSNDDIITNGTTKAGYTVTLSKINDTMLSLNIADTGNGIVSPLTDGVYCIDITSLKM